MAKGVTAFSPERIQFGVSFRLNVCRRSEMPASMGARLMRMPRRYKVTFNERGLVMTAFPDNTWASSDIPPDAVEVSFEQYRKLMGDGHRWNGIEVVKFRPSPYVGDDAEELWQAFFLALGSFIHEFTQTENHLTSILHLSIGLPNEIAHAIFTDAKIARAKDIINKIRAIKGEKRSSFLDKAFDQLGTINSNRNNIVHNGAKLQADGTFIINNPRNANQPALRITPQALMDMEADLETIRACFTMHTLSITSPHVLDEPIGSASPSGQYAKRAQAAWRYKPQRQNPG